MHKKILLIIIIISSINTIFAQTNRLTPDLPGQGINKTSTVRIKTRKAAFLVTVMYKNKESKIQIEKFKLSKYKTKIIYARRNTYIIIKFSRSTQTEKQRKTVLVKGKNHTIYLP